MASFSRLAFVLLDPLGATPAKIFRLSSGVKLTNPALSPKGVSAGPCGGTEDLRHDCSTEGRLVWPEGRRQSKYDWQRGEEGRRSGRGLTETMFKVSLYPDGAGHIAG